MDTLIIIQPLLYISLNTGIGVIAEFWEMPWAACVCAFICVGVRVNIPLIVPWFSITCYHIKYKPLWIIKQIRNQIQHNNRNERKGLMADDTLFVIKLKQYNWHDCLWQTIFKNILKHAFCIDELKYWLKIHWSVNMQLCKVHTSNYIYKTNTSETMSKWSIYHLEESTKKSRLTSMDGLHMRPGVQQQEEQVNVGKQRIPQQTSHLLFVQ